MPRGHPFSARPEKGERAAKEAFPLFGLSPFGAVSHTQSVKARKSRESILSQFFNVTDATGTRSDLFSA